MCLDVAALDAREAIALKHTPALLELAPLEAATRFDLGHAAAGRDASPTQPDCTTSTTCTMNNVEP